MDTIKATQKINVPAQKVWETIRSFEKPERYVPIIKESKVERTNGNAVRTCTLDANGQEVKVTETLESLNNHKKVFVYVITEAPPPIIPGTKIRYEVVDANDNQCDLMISADIENAASQEAKSVLKGNLELVAEGLKKFHEAQ